MGILEKFPTTESLGKFNFDGLNGDDIATIDVKSVAGKIDIPATEEKESSLPTAPSKEKLTANITDLLDKVKSIKADSLIDDIKNSPSLAIEKPSFDVNKVMGGLNKQILPSTLTLPSTGQTGQLEGFADFGDLTEITVTLNKLAQAGSAMPMRLLDMMLSVVQKFAETLSDADKMTQLTQEALDEIYSNELNKLLFSLPVYANEQAAKIMGSANFLSHYQKCFNALNNDATIENQIHFKTLVHKYAILEQINTLQSAQYCFNHLQANNTQTTKTSLNNVINFTKNDDVFIKKYLSNIDEKAITVLSNIKQPIEQLNTMVEQIKSFLDSTVKKTEGIATSISSEIETKINTIEDFLQMVQDKIKEIEKQIKAFIDKLDADKIVIPIKNGCNKISEGVIKVANSVKKIEQKLDDAVANFEKQIIDQQDKQGNIILSPVSQELQKIEQNIRKLLGEVSGALTKEGDIKNALDKAKEGIEKFKNIIQDASLQPVFDIVVDQTQKLDKNIKQINVNKLNTPAKTGLKVSVKVLETVKVDDIIKPKLEDAFKELQEPLVELICLLKEKVLVIENKINEFNPGTLASSLVTDTDAYKSLISTLESIKPSELLKPLEEANQSLTKEVEKLNPQIIIDEIQAIYQQVADVIELLSPEELNATITQTMDDAVFELEQIKGDDLERILTTIKETISIEKLLKTVGLQDIAQADFWKLLEDTLGGKFLNDISKAIAEIEGKLETKKTSFEFNQSMQTLPVLTDVLSRQKKVAVSDYHQSLSTTYNLTDNKKLEKLTETYNQLTKNKDNYTPETKILLEQLNPTMFDEVNIELKKLIDDKTLLKKPFSAINTTITNNNTDNISKEALQNAVVVMYQHQIGNPINDLVTSILKQLEPFSLAVGNIQSLVIKISKEVPEKVDKNIANVLTSIEIAIKKVVAKVIKIIEQLKIAITSTLTKTYEKIKNEADKISPIYLLNSFTLTDFYPTQSIKDKTSHIGGIEKIAEKIKLSEDDKLIAVIKSTIEQGTLTLINNTKLNENTQKAIVRSINAALSNKIIATKNHYDKAIALIKDNLNQQSNIDKVDKVECLRLESLEKLLRQRYKEYKATIDKTTNQKNALIRLNRLILEAHYFDAIQMGVQSIHPFIVAMVATLYPKDTVLKLDGICIDMVKKIEQLPKQMIEEPLNDEFNTLKVIFKETFDISGLFNDLEIKVNGMDEDLSQGLERLSLVYRELLTTCNTKLG